MKGKENNMKQVNRVVALLGAVAMIGSIAACGSGNASDDGADVTLNVWGWEPTLKQANAAFEKKYPNIHLKWNNTGTANERSLA